MSSRGIQRFPSPLRDIRGDDSVSRDAITGAFVAAFPLDCRWGGRATQEEEEKSIYTPQLFKDFYFSSLCVCAHRKFFNKPTPLVLHQTEDSRIVSRMSNVPTQFAGYEREIGGRNGMRGCARAFKERGCARALKERSTFSDRNFWGFRGSLIQLSHLLEKFSFSHDFSITDSRVESNSAFVSKFRRDCFEAIERELCFVNAIEGWPTSIPNGSLENQSRRWRWPTLNQSMTTSYLIRIHLSDHDLILNWLIRLLGIDVNQSKSSASQSKSSALQSSESFY